MDVEQDRRTHVLSEVIHSKAWLQVLPDSAIELLIAVLDDGPHVRDAIDARLRRSHDFHAGLSTPVWLPGSPSQQHLLAELLDLMTAGGLLLIDRRGEYEVNADAPHMLDPASGPLLAMLVSGAAGEASGGDFKACASPRVWT